MIGSKIYHDTATLIYLLEDHPTFITTQRPLTNEYHGFADSRNRKITNQ